MPLTVPTPGKLPAGTLRCWCGAPVRVDPEVTAGANEWLLPAGPLCQCDLCGHLMIVVAGGPRDLTRAEADALAGLPLFEQIVRGIEPWMRDRLMWG